MSNPAPAQIDKFRSLVHSAAAGDAGWLDRLIREAGYSSEVSSGNFKAMRAKEIAALFGATAQAVGLWVKNRGCPRNENGTFDLREVIGWRLLEVEDEVSSGQTSPALERKREADARIAEIRAGEMEGLYLLKSEVEKGRVARIQAVKAALEKLHNRLSPQLEMKSKPEISAIVYEAVQDIFSQFSGGE